MDKQVFPTWSTVWPRCEYEIVYVSSKQTRSSLRRKVPVIAAVPGSTITWYSPVMYGRREPSIVRKYDDRKGADVPWAASMQDEAEKARQPLAREGEEWPPHAALARLNVEDEEAVVRFCTMYGLLGLRYIPRWRERKPFLADDRTVTNAWDSYSAWYDRPKPKIKPPGWHYIQTFCEPLELFKEAVKKYQRVCTLLAAMEGGLDEKKAKSLAFDIEYELLGELDGCIPYPVFEGGRWVFGWRFRSLLEACYFRLFLDMTEGAYGFRRCGNPKCNRLFFAKTGDDTYCCIRCRKQATVDRVAIRQVHRWLRQELKEGKITREQWKAAREEAEKLYYEGAVKDIETLKSLVGSCLDD